MTATRLPNKASFFPTMAALIGTLLTPSAGSILPQHAIQPDGVPPSNYTRPPAPWLPLWQPESADDVLTIKIEIGKCGSSTLMATLLAQRHRKGGYCIVDGRKDKSDPTFHGIIGARQQSPCRSSAVLLGGEYGDCRYVSGKCQYLTLIRDPVHRALSEYNYFCRACSERGKFCKGLRGRETACPHRMSFLEWARKYSLQYTRHFAQQWSHFNEKGFFNISLGYAHQYYHGFAGMELPTERDYEQAKRALTGHTQHPVLAIKVEELDSTGWRRIDRFLGKPGFGIQKSEQLRNRATPLPTDYTPTEAELEEVAKINHWDVAIFNSVRSQATHQVP